jgi:hypothetical protein
MTLPFVAAAAQPIAAKPPVFDHRTDLRRTDGQLRAWTHAGATWLCTRALASVRRAPEFHDPHVTVCACHVTRECQRDVIRIHAADLARADC